jgi:peroxiredoxin
MLRPVGIEAAELTVYAADGLEDKRKIAVPVGPEGARIEPAAPKLGNYHWVVARSEKDDEVRVASTVSYFSNPGKSPTALLAEPKHELEIVPAPLPREHGSYRESEKWTFLVRMSGAPLANQPVTLETQFGSRSTFVSDAQGRVVVLFPRDFKPAVQAPREGGGEMMGPRRAAFVLAADREADGKRYLTAFNYTYSPDGDRDRSLAWGAAFGLIGMVAAVPLLRRRPTKETPNA